MSTILPYASRSVSRGGQSIPARGSVMPSNPDSVKKVVQFLVDGGYDVGAIMGWIYLFSPVWWRGRAVDWTAFWQFQILKYSSIPLSEASRSAMGATLSDSSKWVGGVLGPDGKIYGIPFYATDILIIDPIAGTASRSAMGATLSGSNKWAGGVLGPDGKIYGIPLSATDILIIDPIAGTASRSAMGATLSGSNKWYGGVLGPDGKIYGIPHYATDILIIDPIAGTASRSAMGATLSDSSSKWFGGVLGPDGKIYGIPRDATDILIMGGSEPKYEWMIKGPYLNKL